MVEETKTVLVVEDDADTRAGLVAFVESEGFPVLAAANGREALELLEAAPAPPRLILLDLMMPVMDGWQFLAERRRRADLRSNSSVVLLSGLAFIDGAPDVADFIRKPVDLSVLRACVRRFCGSAVRASAGRRTDSA
jgi:CheY-like chemotaxis protein